MEDWWFHPPKKEDNS